MTTSEEIVAAAEALPEEQRIRVIDRLMESLYSTDKEIDAAWARELARREHALTTGEAKLIPGDEVIEKARRGQL